MKKYPLAAAGLVALFAAGYVAEGRHTEKNWYKSGFVTQCEREHNSAGN
jgi:hypothetical protein